MSAEDQLQAMGERIAELEAELAALRADAERWRALEEMAAKEAMGWHITIHQGHPPADYVVHTALDGIFSGETLAEAFDAARSALDLPTLSSMLGIAPDMTGGMDSVEFVRRQRDGDASGGE